MSPMLQVHLLHSLLSGPNLRVWVLQRLLGMWLELYQYFINIPQKMAPPPFPPLPPFFPHFSPSQRGVGSGVPLKFRAYNVLSMSKEQKNYKTSLCWHFTNKGYCSLYEKCYFAHGQQQLRHKVDPLPPSMPPPVTPVSIYKTQLCKYFMKGYCRNDTNCQFAHGSRDLHGMVIASNAPISPDYGQAGQFLQSIFKNLSQVFPDELAKRVLIKKGMELVATGDLPQANQIINELVSSNNLTQRQKEQCQTILSNAYSLHKINFGQF